MMLHRCARSSASIRSDPSRSGRRTSVDELDRYLDTPDLRLAAAGWACRLRTRGELTTLSLKGPARHEPGDALHLRPEVEGPAGAETSLGRWPPSPARDLLVALGGEAAASRLGLVERFSLLQHRRERVVLAGARRIGLLSLDEVTVMRNGEARGRLMVVEVECRAGEAPDDALVAQLDAALLDVVGLQRDPLTKLEHALRLLGERDTGR